MFPLALCDKMFPALAGQTLDIPFSFQYRPIVHYCNYHGNSRGKASSGIVEQDSFKALNQSALMDDLDSSMHIWISLTGAPVPVLSTADQVTGYTFTWLTQLLVIDNMPAFYSLLPSQYWCCVEILKYSGYSMHKLCVRDFFWTLWFKTNTR